MKMYVKSSFGLRDEDWINPPDYPDTEYGEVSIPIDFTARTDDSGDIEYEADLDEALYDKDWDEEIFQDAEFGFEAVDPSEALETVEDIIRRKFDGQLKPNSKYHFSGNVYIPYDFYADDQGVDESSIEAYYSKATFVIKCNEA